MFYVLLSIIAISFFIPYLASFSDGYNWGQGQFYMQQSHVVSSIGGVLFFTLIIIGFIGFFAGLIFPKYFYFSQNPTRLKAIAFYASIFMLGIVVRMESQYLLINVGHREIQKTIEFSNSIREKMPVEELLSAAKKYQLGPQYGMLGWYYEKISHDRKEDNLPTIEFSFPSFASYFKVVIVMSGPMGDKTALAQKIYIIDHYDDYKRYYK